MSGRARYPVFFANLVYAAVLLALGVAPGVPAIASNVSDHIAHTAAYALQAVLLFLLFLPANGRALAAVLAAVAAAAYGGFVEMLQVFQPTRTVEVLDIGANALGAGMAASLAYLVTHPKRVGRGG